MQNFIGFPLETVEKYLKENNIKYEIKYNNFNIVGDKQLVTNIQEKNGLIILTVSDFIFNLKR